MKSSVSVRCLLGLVATATMAFQSIAGAQAPAGGGRGGRGGAPAAGPRGGQAQPAASALGSKLERIKVFGPSLEGNLEGDDPNRPVVVYLPPSYDKEPNRRYPVVYFLHGYSVDAEAYVGMLRLQQAADQGITAGGREMILVLPDAFTIYSGSMYSNSPTTGDWEGYIAKDLIAYVDGHYRTIANRDSRGLSGHSMGGYGTMRIGMKHPEMFSALYAMSSCCLMNNPAQQGGGGNRGGAPGAAAPAGQPGQTPQAGAGRGQAPAARGQAPAGGQGAAARGHGGAGGGGFANAMSAQAAAWAPNPQNPPQFFDLPTKDGEVQPLIAAKWVANSPLVMVDQYVPNLKQYRAIAMDVGDMDGLGASNIDLDKALTRLGIAHQFEQYEGDHTNRVAARFVANLLPFFSKQLK